MWDWLGELVSHFQQPLGFRGAVGCLYAAPPHAGDCTERSKDRFRIAAKAPWRDRKREGMAGSWL
jgi:hypothetical protein